MAGAIVAWLSGIPAPLAASAIAFLPIVELRLALPLALTTLHLSPPVALVSCIAGNLLPIPLIFWLLPSFLRWAQRRSPRLNRFVEEHLHALEHRYHARFHRWGSFVLFFITAAPLPGVGVWTASVLAILFAVEPKRAAAVLVSGVVVGGLIVLALTLGTVRIFQAF